MIYPWLQGAFLTSRESLKAGAHALLLSGPRGLGKRALAEHLTQWRLCDAPGDGGGCGQCQSCHWLAAGNHPDRIALEPAAESEEEGSANPDTPPSKAKGKPSRYIVVDQVRTLLSQLELAPHTPLGRVVIVDPAQQMNQAAANALLKTLEEPAPRTIFILVTSAEERLPMTVKSRCRRLSIGLPEPAAGVAWLMTEGVTQAAAQALRLAGGAPLRARELVDTELMQRWGRLTQRLDADSLRRLGWETTPEALADLCVTLQMLCVDLQRLQAGSEPQYDERGSALGVIARRLPAPAISDLWREVGKARALIQHPLNGALVRDQLLIGFERMLASS